MLRRAASSALEIAAGTSRALPRPKPTRPLPSPTTVKAVKEKMRPPLTTLATRSTATSFSTRPSFCSTLAMIRTPSRFHEQHQPRL